MVINVLTDYRGWFWGSIRLLPRRVLSFDIERLRRYAGGLDIQLNFLHYSDVDFVANDYRGQVFLYTSAEDRGLFYKGYIEDVVMGLRCQGAIVLPDYPLLRAHHNKVFMEICRDVYLKGIDTGIFSARFGTWEEFLLLGDKVSYPCVLKMSEGAGSRSVFLIGSREEAMKRIRRESFVFNLKYIVKGIAGRFNPFSLYRRKFVVQNFVGGLDGDYKILVFGSKYYVFGRKNRENDFRASGSLRFNFEPLVPDGMFAFAKRVYRSLDVPVCSLDVAFDGERFYLMEFQCVSFGTVGLERSTHYWVEESGQWARKDGESVLEEEFMIAVDEFVRRING